MIAPQRIAARGVVGEVVEVPLGRPRQVPGEDSEHAAASDSQALRLIR
jgi:hypothetical protein